MAPTFWLLVRLSKNIKKTKIQHAIWWLIYALNQNIFLLLIGLFSLCLAIPRALESELISDENTYMIKPAAWRTKPLHAKVNSYD